LNKHCIPIGGSWMNLARSHAFLLQLAFCSLAFADQLTLQNGDRISGTIVRSNEKELLIETEFIGKVKVAQKGIRGIETDKDVFLTLRSGKVVHGKMVTRLDHFEVTRQGFEVIRVRRSEVTAIRSADEQSAYELTQERLKNPRLVDIWTAFLDAGLSLSRGNADTTTYTTAAKAQRETPGKKLILSWTSILAEAHTTGISEATAEAVRGGIRYEGNVSPRLFLFGFSDFEYDRFQGLDLRTVLGGGLGYNVMKTSRVDFSVNVGSSWNQEYFTDGLTRHSGEALLGEELTYKVAQNTVLTQKLVIFPNLTRPGNFRVNWDSSAVTKLNSWLGWDVSFSNRYLTNPLSGRLRNDMLLTTGMRVGFGNNGELLGNGELEAGTDAAQ
ncbi:MAG: DUF481 domain-containing protein, partial [Bryobacteraceae bacterium]